MSLEKFHNYEETSIESLYLRENDDMLGVHVRFLSGVNRFFSLNGVSWKLEIGVGVENDNPYLKMVGKGELGWVAFVNADDEAEVVLITEEIWSV